MKTLMNQLSAALALAAASLVAGPTAHAAVITFSPVSVVTSPGASVVVDVRVSALGTGNTVGGFDLDIGYDQARLSFNNVAFGPALGNPALLEAITSASMMGPGLLDISEVSLLTPAQLAAAQGASFTLATLSFTAVTSGTTGFSLLPTSALSDAFGRPLPIETTTPAIPEPETLALLSLGLAALAVKRRSQGSAPASP